MARLNGGFQLGFCRAPSTVPLPICVQPSFQVPCNCVVLKQRLPMGSQITCRTQLQHRSRLFTTPQSFTFSNSALRYAQLFAQLGSVWWQVIYSWVYQIVCAESFASSRWGLQLQTWYAFILLSSLLSLTRDSLNSSLYPLYKSLSPRHWGTHYMYYSTMWREWLRSRDAELVLRSASLQTTAKNILLTLLSSGAVPYALLGFCTVLGLWGQLWAFGASSWVSWVLLS